MQERDQEFYVEHYDGNMIQDFKKKINNKPEGYKSLNKSDLLSSMKEKQGQHIKFNYDDDTYEIMGDSSNQTSSSFLNPSDSQGEKYL